MKGRPGTNVMRVSCNSSDFPRFMRYRKSINEICLITDLLNTWDVSDKAIEL